MSENLDHKWHGAAYVIAGRMLDTLHAIKAQLNDTDEAAAMKVWAVAHYIVNNYRKATFDGGKSNDSQNDTKTRNTRH